MRALSTLCDVSWVPQVSDVTERAGRGQSASCTGGVQEHLCLSPHFREPLRPQVGSDIFVFLIFQSGLKCVNY